MSDQSDQYDLMIRTQPSDHLDDEFGEDEEEMDEGGDEVSEVGHDPALEEEHRRLAQLLQAQLERENALGAKFCDPGHILNEANAILKAIALIQSKQMPGGEALIAMAHRAVANRLEPPAISSMVASAVRPWEAGPYVRRISATTRCLLLVAAPTTLDMPSPFLRDQVRTIMKEEEMMMTKNNCEAFLAHLYNGLRMVRLLPDKPIPLGFRDLPVLWCKCTTKERPPLQLSWTRSTGTASEEEHSLAREIFLGSTTITLGTGQQELSGHAAQGPSGHGEPEDAVAVSTVNTEGTVGDGAPCPGEALAIPPMAVPADTQSDVEMETAREPRVFALAGFIPEMWTSFDVRGAKEKMIKMIKDLNGLINESDEWVQNTTHVINVVPGPEFGMSEKTMAGIAAGRWVVTMGYVEESHQRRVWLDNERNHLAAPESQVLLRRLRARALGDEGLMFYGMITAVVIGDRRKAQVFERIIRAGGGSVVEATGLAELAEVYPVGLTHVFMKPWVGQNDPPGLQELERAGQGTGLHICDYKILFHKVRGARANEEDWQIRGPRAKLNAEDMETNGGIEPEKEKEPKKARLMEVQVSDPVPTTSQRAQKDPEPKVMILAQRDPEPKEPANKGTRNQGKPGGSRPKGAVREPANQEPGNQETRNQGEPGGSKAKGAVPKFRISQGVSQKRGSPGPKAADQRPDPMAQEAQEDRNSEGNPQITPDDGATANEPIEEKTDATSSLGSEEMPPLVRPNSPSPSTPEAENDESPSPPMPAHDAEELCVICQEMIEAEDVCTLGCSHVLHARCAENWLRVSPRCPTCRERCNEDNFALLPPGDGRGRTTVCANGAVLTNRFQPDGRPPVRVTVERLPERRPNQRMDANVQGASRRGVYQDTGFTIHPAVERRARTCSANQRTRRARSQPRASGNGVAQDRRARTVTALRASPAGRGRLVNAASTSRLAVRRMSQPGNHWRNAENHWSQQRYSRTPEGPWRIPNEVAEPENVEMQATQTQANTEEGLRRAFVGMQATQAQANTTEGLGRAFVEMQATQNQTNTEEGLRRAFVSGFSFGSVTIGVSPQERIARHNEEEARALRIRNQTTRGADVIMERLSGLATNAMYLIVISLMLLLIPRTSADMIDPPKANRHQDPSVITSFRAGDVLAFENNPRSMSLGMTSEAVDVSILFNLKEQLWKLVQHAGSLGSNNLVSRSACEHFCQPMGYATKMTEVLKKELKMPHYVFTRESHNRPEKTYFVLLLEDGNGKRYCNYSLSHSATFSLTSALDIGSPYYTESRSEKYSIYALWLVDERGQACKDGVNVKRGEIVPGDTDYEVTIMHSHGSLWGCIDVCHNINGLRETALKYPGCVLGQDCQNFTHSRCEVWSYNYIKSRCRISGLPDPGRDLDTYNGYNALMANHQCRSHQQHQSTLILVNETLHEVSRVCKYSENQPPSSQHLYRSCPGVADSLLTDVIPLTTSLEGYVMSLKRTLGSRAKGNDSVQISLEDVKDRRGAPTSGAGRSKEVQRTRRSIPVTALMATLRPTLTNFLHLGQAHLAAGIGKVFLGSALPMGNLLLLTTNILTMIVTMAAGLPSVAHYDTNARLEEAKNEKYQDWALVTTPDLFTLKATNEVCNADDLLTADSIPSLLRGMHEALNRLQAPLKRIVEDASPISDEVRDHIKKEGKEYGFWSRYFEDQNLVIRYFAYKVTGGPETSVTQVSVLAGNSLSPVIQGTVIAGGARRPGTTTPSWSCIGFVKEKGDQNLPWIPRECYQSPILSNSEVYTTNFLPDAQLIRVWGQHSMGHSCPKVPPGIIRARGLLVFVIGRECQVTMDGVHLRPEDQTAESPWTRPVLLVDRENEYPMPEIEGALYPKQLVHAITRLTNESIHPALQGIKAETEDESQARATTDQVLGVTLFLAIVIVLVMMLACYRRVRIWKWIQKPGNEGVNRQRFSLKSWKRGREEPSTSALEVDNQDESVNK